MPVLGPPHWRLCAGWGGAVGLRHGDGQCCGEPSQCGPGLFAPGHDLRPTLGVRAGGRGPLASARGSRRTVDRCAVGTCDARRHAHVQRVSQTGLEACLAVGVLPVVAVGPQPAHLFVRVKQPSEQGSDGRVVDRANRPNLVQGGRCRGHLGPRSRPGEAQASTRDAEPSHRGGDQYVGLTRILAPRPWGVLAPSRGPRRGGRTSVHRALDRPDPYPEPRLPPASDTQQGAPGLARCLTWSGAAVGGGHPTSPASRPSRAGHAPGRP